MTRPALLLTLLSACALIACGSDDGASVVDTTPDTTEDVQTPGGADVSADDDDLSSTDDASPDQAAIVQIVAPVNGASVDGSIQVRLEPVGVDELVADYVTLALNGEQIFADTKLPTEFTLDTRHYPPGPLELEAFAQANFEQGGDLVRVSAFNPQLSFVEVTPPLSEVRNGQVVSLIVEIDGPPEVHLTADFSALDSGFEPGAETSYAIGGGRYAVSYVITEDNQRRDAVYPVSVTAKVNDWVVVYDTLHVTLRNLPANPLRVEGGIYVDSRLPATDNDWGEDAPAATSENDFIVTGGSVPLSVDFSDFTFPDEIIGVLIGLEGHVGYYQVPLTRDEDAKLDVKLVLRSYASFETPPSLLPVRVAVRDVTGRVSPFGAHLLNVTPVGSGDIQVSVSWDTPTDVDLHVVAPGGCEIYYGNREDCGGGELDLDSNAGCSLDNVNNENVYWPSGQAPVGTYTVRVDFWSDCNDSGANYAVTVNACGRTEIHEGSFAPGDDNRGGAGDGVTVATFSNEICQSSIRGRIRYQDRVFDERGFGALTWQPVRNAVVELRQLSTGDVIATSATDRAGNYEIQFTNDGPPGLVIAVKTKTDVAEGLRDIEVNNHPKFSDLYEVTSLPLIFDPNQEVLEQDIDITVELGAGAFNIFDVVQRGYDLVRLMTGRQLGELNAFWQTGTDTTDTLYCSSFLYTEGTCSELEALSVQGKDTDRDEYDDMVILKEFFKFALNRLSVDSHPGGLADGTRGDPNQSWSEGVATFFANDVSLTRFFVNSRPHGVYLVDDVEAASNPFSFGIDGSALHDGLSPFLVAALLWDLADGIAGNEVFDEVHQLRQGIYDVLFNYLPSSRYVDRGAEGVDLVDFLDGWFCRGWGKHDEIEALANEHRAFPYDYAGPTGCEHL